MYGSGRHDRGAVGSIPDPPHTDDGIRVVETDPTLWVLPSRTDLQAMAQRCAEAGIPVAILAVRITGLSSLHPSTAAAALETLARRIRRLEATMALAPQSDDAFVVLSHAGTLDRARGHAHEIRRMARTNVADLAPTHLLRACVAVALVDAETEASEAMASAVSVATHTRSIAPDHTAVCDVSPAAWSQRQLEMARRLTTGLRRSDLVVEYQPVVTPDGAVVAAESLLRVAHANGEWAGPEEFLSLAVQVGATPVLTDLVASTVAADLVWHDRVTDDRLDWVSCNATLDQVVDRDFVPTLLRTIADHDLDPERLVVEISETALVGDGLELAETLATVRDIGIGVAVDDFGSGLGSFRLLDAPGLSMVKLDRRLTAEVMRSDSARRFVEAVADRCHERGLLLVAEGIEHRATGEVLAAAGCTHLQGFAFGAAEPITAFAAGDALGTVS